MRRYFTTLIAAIVAVSIAAPANAQFGGLLRRVVPGASGGTAANPDSFLAETVETTRFMMIAAAVLNHAATTRTGDEGSDALRARIAQCQGMSTVGEMHAGRAAFEADISAMESNQQLEADLRARYEEANAQRRELLMSAAYNMMLGMLRNTQLAAQSPGMLRSIMANPLMLGRVGALREAGELIVIQGRATRSMMGPIRSLMASGNVESPADPHTTQARAVTL